MTFIIYIKKEKLQIVLLNQYIKVSVVDYTFGTLMMSVVEIRKKVKKADVT